MTYPAIASDANLKANDRLIVALDVDSAAKARGVVADLSGNVGAFKIGLQLFIAAGPSFVREVVETGEKVFLDLKFHDIPNTVAKAAIEAARLGVWMLNVHALGGSEMMKRTIGEVANVCEKEHLPPPKIIAVTVLTSADQSALWEVGIQGEPESAAVMLARLAAKSGLDGVVASPHEISAIRNSIEDKELLIVTPGIRPGFATNDDQKRVMTPTAALAAGSDYLVIGRPIIQADDGAAALAKILEEIEST
ncbi:MAG: orotidine-5'-phosphate decarboxylase [Pyrinomonadaceae bacterium]